MLSGYMYVIMVCMIYNAAIIVMHESTKHEDSYKPVHKRITLLKSCVQLFTTIIQYNCIALKYTACE